MKGQYKQCEGLLAPKELQLMWSDSLLKIEGWGSGGAGRRIPYFTGCAGPG